MGWGTHAVHSLPIAGLKSQSKSLSHLGKSLFPIYSTTCVLPDMQVCQTFNPNRPEAVWPRWETRQGSGGSEVGMCSKQEEVIIQARERAREGTIWRQDMLNFESVVGVLTKWLPQGIKLLNSQQRAVCHHPFLCLFLCVGLHTANE